KYDGYRLLLAIPDREQQAISVIFILVEPAGAGRRLIDQRGELRLCERRRRLRCLALRPSALLPAAIGFPDVLARGDLGHRPAGGHAGHAIVYQRIAIVRVGKVVCDLLQHPRLRLLAGLRLQAEHHPLALHAVAFEGEVEVPLFDGLAGVLARIRDPAPLVPQHHRAAAIFALGDRAFESAVVQGMVLGAHRQPVLARVQARAFRNRPALQDAVELQPEIPVQSRGVMLLDDEAVAFALERAPPRLLRPREVAFLVVGLDVERDLGRHNYALLRAGAFSGSFLAEAFLAADFLDLASALPFFSSPRLFFSAAIRSMTFEPLGGGASASGSSMIFSPF